MNVALSIARPGTALSRSDENEIDKQKRHDPPQVMPFFVGFVFLALKTLCWRSD